MEDGSTTDRKGEYGGMVQRLPASFLKDREEAEDASQEIFFRVFRSPHSFSLEKPFLPWIYAVARNYLRTRQARTRRTKSRFVRSDIEIATKSSDADPGAILEAVTARSEILRAIASLPESIREVVALYYGEAMSEELGERIQFRDRRNSVGA